MEKVTIRDLMAKSVDVDMFNDVTDDIAPAFSGVLNLTDDGEEKYADILDLECDLDEDNASCVVLIDGRDDWEKMWRKVCSFCASAAGYCDFETWQKLFYE